MNPLFKTPDKIPVMAIRSIISGNTLAFDSSSHPQLKKFILSIMNDSKKTSQENEGSSTDSSTTDSTTIQTLQTDVATLQEQIAALTKRIEQLEEATGTSEI